MAFPELDNYFFPRIRPRYDIVDPHSVQSDHLHALSNQLPRKTTRKDGGVNHLRNRQGQLTDINKESSAFKSPAVKSSISLEIHKKDGDTVKPLPPPLVRPSANTLLSNTKQLAFFCCLHLSKNKAFGFVLLASFIKYRAFGFLLLALFIKCRALGFLLLALFIKIQSIWFSFVGLIYEIQSIWLSFARSIYQIQSIWLSFVGFILSSAEHLAFFCSLYSSNTDNLASHLISQQREQCKLAWIANRWCTYSIFMSSSGLHRFC